MRALFLSVACGLLATVVAADEPPVPKTLIRPVTALATAKLDGKKVIVTLKVVDTATEVRTAKRTVYVPVEKTVGGKTVTEGVPKEEVYQFTVQVPKGFREVQIPASALTARDTAGKTIAEKKLSELLATATPVLLSNSPDPIDPYHLLTTKEGTVILHIDQGQMAPAKEPGPAPKGVPPIPAPKKEASAKGLPKFLTENKFPFHAEDFTSGAIVQVGPGLFAPNGPCRVFSVELKETNDAKLKAFADLASKPATVERIYLTGKDVTAAGLKECCRVTSIRDFGGSVGGAGVKAADFECLAQLTELTALNLGDMNFGDELIETVRGIGTLRSLSLNDCDVTDAGVARLTEMNLERLYINSTRLTPATWDSLAKMSKLTSLELIRCPNLTGVGLRKVKALPLQAITLRQTGIKDAGVQQLAEISTLRDVKLSENAITDAGAMRLAKLPLTSLDLRQTKVTADGIMKLAAALPACRIEWDGGVIEPKPAG